jgi:hypothetical protein
MIEYAIVVVRSHSLEAIEMANSSREESANDRRFSGVFGRTSEP